MTSVKRVDAALVFTCGTQVLFRKDAPGVDGGLADDSMSFDKSFLFDLTSSLVILWVDLVPNS